MLRGLFTIVGILLASSAHARFAHGTPSYPQITCDLVTGVASVGGPCTLGTNCNGSGDDAPAFKAFHDWAVANQSASTQVVATLPAGKNCVFNSNAYTVGGALGGVQNTFAVGINNLLFDGNGSSLTAGTASYWLGSAGVCQAGLTSVSGCSARIQSTTPGLTTVTLTAASLAAGYASRFSVGDWIMVGGLDVQGQWNYACGFPMNQTYFEWAQVTNVNAGTGVITLDRSLTNTYLSTWPSYNSGAPPGASPGTACSNGEADNGGPATIWKVGGAGYPWGVRLEYRNLTLNQSSGQIYAGARYVTYRNVTFSGGGLGAIPTQNEIFVAYNTTWPIPGAIEVDKLIGTFILDTTSMSLLQFQSNSTDYFIARNATFSNGVQGGGKRTEITDSTLTDFRPGSYAYGNTPGPVICTRCSVTTWQNGGIAQNDNPSPYSMNGGVISFPNTAATGAGPAQRWASTIGKSIFFGTNAAVGYSSVGVFRVLGVTQDGTNTYVQTNQSGGFPDYANLGGTRITFNTNGAQQFTCDACTGDPSFTAMNLQAGATPLAPMMTYASRSYAPSALGAAGSMPGVGRLTSLRVNVTTAYTGTGSLTLHPTGQFHNFAVKQSDWSSYDWFPAINLKQAGDRIITPSGVTCDGVPSATGCAGDSSMTVPEAIWIQSGVAPDLTGTLSGGVNPQFTITLRTDQTP